jgi:hypothetical protein
MTETSQTDTQLNSNSRSEVRTHLEVLCILVVVFITQAALPDKDWSRAVQVVLQTIALVLTLRLGTLSRPVIAAGRVVVVLAIVTSLVILVSDVGRNAMLFVNLVVVALAPVAILRSMIRQKQITWATVVGAVSIYMCIGLFFACFHQIIFEFDDTAFAVANGVLRPATFQYFSFITLTTVGFGDVVAVSDFARTMTALEAVIGQIFLVTVVALVVGNIGRSRRPETSN